ncbi:MULTISPECIES: hypothetical protein [unclassified Streptomyces]|uniref:hypothetical protein n=1 Tax=unclassified Streptomyces TaxID=2593676 RepID=UPI001F10C169|nr:MULTISPECIES: hypothetical protein [unclassified Streptomyces]
MTAPGPLNALYARVAAPAAPAVPLAWRERRRASEDLPTIPIRGLELTTGEAAAALFETGADELALPVPDTDTLYDALNGAVRTLGPAGIAEVLGIFPELDAEEFPEVGACRHFAYRLALSFWYEDARSRPMTVGEAAVALYLSDAYRHHQIDAHTVRRAPLLVSRAIRQGAALVPIETLVRLGETMRREFTAPVTPLVTQVSPSDADASHEGVTVVTPGRDWLYRQALPNWHRRRFCFDLMRADVRQPSPLVVRLDGGGYALGATPPAGPDGTWRRPLRAEW